MKFKIRPLVLMMGLMPAVAMASSHRQAPFITSMPQVDAGDFIMLMNYEPGREGYVTLLANDDPLRESYSGPNFHFLDPKAAYDFNLDSDGDGDGKPHPLFRFGFTNTYKNPKMPVAGKSTVVPLINVGQISATDQGALNRTETYTVEGRQGNQKHARWSRPHYFSKGADGYSTLIEPVDNIGNKSNAACAGSHVCTVKATVSSQPARAFFGQRKDGFVANFGEVCDLVNLNPPGRGAARSTRSPTRT